MFAIFRFAPLFIIAAGLILTNQEIQAFAKSLSLFLLALLLWPFQKMAQLFKRGSN